jgi:hypothetical protein
MLARRLRQMPKAASKTVIGEVIGARRVQQVRQRIGFRLADQDGDDGGRIDDCRLRAKQMIVEY